MGNLALSSIFTPIGIAHFFFAGVTSEEALNCLIQAHHNCPLFFPLLDLATVNYWYNLFQNGFLHQLHNPPVPGVLSTPQSPILAPIHIQSPFMWQLPVQAPPLMAPWMSMPHAPEEFLPEPMLYPVLLPGAEPEEPERPPIPLLHQLPVYHKIVHELNGHDQRSLKRVCREFNEYIRNEDRLYRTIELTVRQNSIILNVKSGAIPVKRRIIYQKTDEGCLIKANGEITPSEKAPLEECLLKLKEYIEKINTRIEKFVVSQTAAVEIKPLLQEIALIMGKLKCKLTIENLEVDTSDFVAFEAFMGEIQSGSLISLQIRNLDVENEELKLFNMTSRLFPFLENFFVRNARIDIPLEALAHAKAVIANFPPVTPAQFLNYRERLLQFESILIHKLSFPEGFNLQLGHNVELDEEDDSFQEIGRILFPRRKNYIIVIRKKKSDYELRRRSLLC
ncbi:unnamed protein product [Caenorhabditis brenneri]